MSTSNSNIKSSHPLVKLGLTSCEVACFCLLSEVGSLSIRQMAERLHILPNAIYRTATHLQEMGFVVRLATHPMSYQAIPAKVAIDTLTKQKTKQIEELSILSMQSLALSKKPTAHTTIKIITGKTALYEASIECLQDVEKEVLIVSIGQTVSDEIKIANRDCILRGVKIKMLVHINDETNRNILSSWIKMGLEVRHYPDSGYHLMVYDSNTIILSAYDPLKSEERAGIVMHSKGVAQAMSSYFYSIWRKAAVVVLE